MPTVDKGGINIQLRVRAALVLVGAAFFVLVSTLWYL